MNTFDGLTPSFEGLTNTFAGIGRCSPFRFLLLSSGWKSITEGVVESFEVSSSAEAMFWDKNSSA